MNNDLSFRKLQYKHNEQKYALAAPRRHESDEQDD